MVPLIIAHRGGAYESPENTFIAFDRAVALHADGIETDVRMTSDGVCVLYHDSTLYKISRSRKRVADLPLKEILELDCGKWYDPKFAGEKIPTFSEFSERYIGKTLLMIEIKSQPGDRKSGRNLKLADAVINRLTEQDITRFTDAVFILSFDPDVLKYAAQKEPTLRYVLNLSCDAADPTSASGILKPDRPDISHLSGICVKEKFLSEPLTEFVHGSGKLLITYSVNTRRQLNRASEMNADAMITDRPEWLIKMPVKGRTFQNE